MSGGVQKKKTWRPETHLSVSFFVVNLSMLVQHVLWSFLSRAPWASGSFYSGGKWRLDLTGRSTVGSSGTGGGWGHLACLWLMLVILSGSRSKVGQLLSARCETSPSSWRYQELWSLFVRYGGEEVSSSSLGFWLDTQDVYIHPQTGCSAAVPGCCWIRSYVVL